MSDVITFLTSKGPRLTKRWLADGTVEGTEDAKQFSVETVPVRGLPDLHTLLQSRCGSPRVAVIRGVAAPGTDTDRTPRNLITFPDQPHHWVCLDVDDYDTGDAGWVDDPVPHLDRFIRQSLPAGFHHVSYVWHLSGSAGHPSAPTKMKAHLWFWLDRPRLSAELQEWKKALAIAVDVATLRQVQLHYIAAPVLDPGVECPVRQRTGFVEGVLADEATTESFDDLPDVSTQRRRRDEMTDPRGIPGIVGAFCRLVSPERAVDEFLAGHFEFEGDSDHRLNWLRSGSGANGGAVITTDGLRVYNSHGSDPAEGRAMNSWDLIRTHLFGDMDAGAEPGTPPAQLPSHAAMRAWALEHVEGLAEEVRAARPTAADDWADFEDDPEEVAAEATRAAEAAEDSQAVADAEERRRLRRLRHVETLRAGVLGCGDAESLKAYIDREIVPDGLIDETDRNGVLTMAVQARFAALGSPQKRDDVRRMLRPPPPALAAGGGGPEWLADWVYLHGDRRFFNLKRKRSTDPAGFDAMHTLEMPLNSGGVLRERASEWAVHVWGIQVADRALYAPGMPALFDALDQTWANSYREDSVPVAVPVGDHAGAVTMVMKHLERLFPDPREREILISWMAHNVQRPGKKIRWAPYIYGAPGVGKTFLAELLGIVMGERNVRVISGTALQSNFNGGWVVGAAVVAIEEVYQAGHLFENEEKLKAPIANSKVDVHPKGVDVYPAPNFTNYLLLSNHADGVPVGETDRRFFFLKCAMTADEATALDEEGYYDNLFDTCRACAGVLRQWLLDVDLHPGFRADGRAPKTAARAKVIEMSKSDVRLVLEGVVGDEAVTSTAVVTAGLKRNGVDVPKGRAMNKALSDMGFEYWGQVRTGTTTTRVYTRPRLASAPLDMIKQELARLARPEFEDDD